MSLHFYHSVTKVTIVRKVFNKNSETIEQANDKVTKDESRKNKDKRMYKTEIKQELKKD